MKNITPADVDFIYKLVIPHMEEKVKYIAMEMMQNILKYQHPGHKDKSQMSIIPDESSYVMKFSNYIPYDEEKIDTLQSRIDVANMFTLSELKQAYRATLSNGTYTEK
ncbi:hypothetical protein KKG31_07195 [Patescibacteria group bacterium]|nr:hypothetical protein [Patescibacteria group bacterium]MBU1758865.1 hypothetical protein [Patescibacteria group bacterium]